MDYLVLPRVQELGNYRVRSFAYQEFLANFITRFIQFLENVTLSLSRTGKLTNIQLLVNFLSLWSSYSYNIIWTFSLKFISELFCGIDKG